MTERQQLALLRKQDDGYQAVTNVYKRNANGETPLHVAAIKVDAFTRQTVPLSIN